MPEELEFERPILELGNRIAELRAAEGPVAAREEIGKLEDRLRRLQQRVYGRLTAWQRAQLARHPRRPHALDLIRLVLDDFVELHGDRLFADDAAIVGWLAAFEGEPVGVIVHQRGRETREKRARKFGPPQPERHRKAPRPPG